MAEVFDHRQDLTKHLKFLEVLLVLALQVGHDLAVERELAAQLSLMLGLRREVRENVKLSCHRLEVFLLAVNHSLDVLNEIRLVLYLPFLHGRHIRQALVT